MCLCYIPRAPLPIISKEYHETTQEMKPGHSPHKDESRIENKKWVSGFKTSSFADRLIPQQFITRTQVVGRCCVVKGKVHFEMHTRTCWPEYRDDAPLPMTPQKRRRKWKRNSYGRERDCPNGSTLISCSYFHILYQRLLSFDRLFCGNYTFSTSIRFIHKYRRRHRDLWYAVVHTFDSIRDDKVRC